MTIKKGKCKVTHVGYYDDEYVYDIGMKNGDHNWFFGNNILLKNTDSAYFSVYEAYKALGKEYNLSRDETIQLYNSLCRQVNSTFPAFMNSRFSTGLERGAIMNAERENLSDYGLFIKKKRYVMNLYDKDGKRLDKNGKTGKMKAMGIEIKRSDTPKIVQNVLTHGLEVLLKGKPEDEVLNVFVDFKKEILDISPWMVARPCGANAVTFYTNQYKDYMSGKLKKKPRIPAAIAGAIHFNMLLDHHKEDHMPRVGDGSKVFNCKLKRNSSGFDCISYPTDMTHFPDWFTKLPFDMNATIETVFLKKVDNIFGVLGWDFKILQANNNFFENFIEDDGTDF